MCRWVESNCWPYGVNVLRCFGQEGIINYQWSTFLGSSLVVNLLLQVLLILKQENEWKYKITKNAFRICKIHSKTSKMDWNAAAICFQWGLWRVNAAIMQWCALKPSFVPWLYQTFMIIQDKERYVFLCCSDKELPFFHRAGGRFLTNQEQRKGFKEQQGINRSPSNSWQGQDWWSDWPRATGRPTSQIYSHRWNLTNLCLAFSTNTTENRRLQQHKQPVFQKWYGRLT